MSWKCCPKLPPIPSRYPMRCQEPACRMAQRHSWNRWPPPARRRSETPIDSGNHVDRHLPAAADSPRRGLGRAEPVRNSAARPHALRRLQPRAYLLQTPPSARGWCTCHRPEFASDNCRPHPSTRSPVLLSWHLTRKRLHRESAYRPTSPHREWLSPLPPAQQFAPERRVEGKRRRTKEQDSATQEQSCL